MKTFKNMHSTRSLNGISRCFGPQVLETSEVLAAAGPDRVKMTYQLWLKSLREIASNLCKYGFINDERQWHESKIEFNCKGDAYEFR